MSSLGRRNRAKQLENDSRSQNPPNLPPPQNPAQDLSPDDHPPRKGFLSGISKAWKVFWGIIGGAALLLALFHNFYNVKEDLRSDKQKADDAKGPSGDLKMPLSKPMDSSGEIPKPLLSTPPNDTSLLSCPKHLPPGFKPIKDGEVFKGIRIPGLAEMNSFTISLCNGSSMMGLDALYRGLNVFASSRAYHRNDSFYIKAINDRVYISATFTDLENGYVVAGIDYNHWHVVTANSYTYFPTDTSLEVRDNRNEIILSVTYYRGTGTSQDKDKLKINGYFIDDTSILVSGIAGLMGAFPISKTDKNWKEKARIQIRKIPSIAPSSAPEQSRY